MVVGYGEGERGFCWACGVFVCAALLTSCQGEDTTRSQYGSALDGSDQGAGEETALSEEELEKELELSLESATVTEMGQTNFDLFLAKRRAEEDSPQSATDIPPPVQVLVVVQDSNRFFATQPGAGSVEAYRKTVHRNLDSLVTYASEKGSSQLRVAMVTSPSFDSFGKQENVWHIQDTFLSGGRSQHIPKVIGAVVKKLKKRAISLKRVSYLAFAKGNVNNRSMRGYLNLFFRGNGTKIVVNFSPSSACKRYKTIVILGGAFIKGKGAATFPWCDWVSTEGVAERISIVHGADQKNKFRFYTVRPHQLLNPKKPFVSFNSPRNYHKLAHDFGGTVYHSTGDVTVPWSEILHHGTEE